MIGPPRFIAGTTTLRLCNWTDQARLYLRERELGLISQSRMNIKLRLLGKHSKCFAAATAVALFILIFTTGLLVFNNVNYFESTPQSPSSSSSGPDYGHDRFFPSPQGARSPAERIHSVSRRSPKRTRRSIAREAMRAVSQVSDKGHRFVIATAGTYAYRRHVSNLACSLRPRYKILLVALDSRIYSADNILPDNVRRLLLKSGRSSRAEGYSSLSRFGTNGFNSLTRRKLSAAIEILSAGYDLLFVDGDAVFCNPITGIAQLVSQDKDSHIIAQRAAIRYQWINTGVYYARSTPATIALFRAAERFHLPQDDQAIMNKLACEPRYGGEKIYRDGKFHACRWRETTTISFLPTEKFPLGCSKIDGRRVNSHRASTIRRFCISRRVALVHYSCFSSGNKKLAMKKHGMWLAKGITGSECSKVDWMRSG